MDEKYWERHDAVTKILTDTVDVLTAHKLSGKKVGKGTILMLSDNISKSLMDFIKEQA